MKVQGVTPAGVVVQYEPLDDDALRQLEVSEAKSPPDPTGDDDQGETAKGMARLIEFLAQSQRRASRRDRRRSHSRLGYALKSYLALDELEFQEEQKGRHLSLRR